MQNTENNNHVRKNNTLKENFECSQEIKTTQETFSESNRSRIKTNIRKHKDEFETYL